MLTDLPTETEGNSVGVGQHAPEAGVDEGRRGLPPARSAVRLRAQVPQERHQELPHLPPGLLPQAASLRQEEGKPAQVS